MFHNIHELVQIVQIIGGLFASARDYLLAYNNRNEVEYAMVLCSIRISLHVYTLKSSRIVRIGLHVYTLKPSRIVRIGLHVYTLEPSRIVRIGLHVYTLEPSRIVRIGLHVYTLEPSRIVRIGLHVYTQRSERIYADFTCFISRIKDCGFEVCGCRCGGRKIASQTSVKWEVLLTIKFF